MPLSVSRWTPFDQLPDNLERTLLCEVSPDGEPLSELVRWRMRGFRGGVILEGTPPQLLNTAQYPWLQEDLRQALGFYLSEEVDDLPPPLDEAAWRHSVWILFVLQTRSLNHDFKHLLKEWPERRHDLTHLWQRMVQELGQVRPLLEAPLNTMQHLLHSAETTAATLQEAWLGFWEALQGLRQTPLDHEAFTRAIHSLSLHWPALITARTNLDKALQDHEIPPELEAWLKSFQARHLMQNLKVQRAAQQLKPLRNQLHSALQRLLHNSIEQHLYVVAELLLRWQHSSEMHYPDLDGLHYQSLDQWQNRHPMPQGSTLNHAGATQPSGSAPSKPYLLLLEDNPIWAEQIYQHLYAHPALQAYLKNYTWTWAQNLLSAKKYMAQAGLVIADLSMPLHAEESSAREHGIAFLESCLARYLKHPPTVVVHTTPTHFLEDHLALQGTGIKDVNYILKSEPDALCDRLLSLWEQAQKPAPHQLVLYPHHLVLDGVPLRLSPRNDLLLRLLAEQGPLHSRQILSKLVEQGYDEYTLDLNQRPRSGLTLHWNDFLAVLPRTLAESLKQLETALQEKLWHDLQQWSALARAEGHQDLERLQQRLPQNLWQHNPQLKALLPTVLPHLITASEASENPDSRLHNKVSKMVHSLRQEVYTQGIAAQHPLNTRAWIQRNAQGQYHLSPTRREYADSERPERWQVLCIEDDPVYAQEMQQLLQEMALRQGMQLHCHWIAHGEDWEQFLARYTPDSDPLLILLDLHLPAQANGPADARTGYAIWQSIQSHFAPENYQVLVTSTLTHEDHLRLEGIRLGIPLQHFIPKGETLYQLNWPESLCMAILRVWQSYRQGGFVPADQVTPQGEDFPLRVEVLKDQSEVLTLCIHTPYGKAEASHKDDYARCLRQLLRQPGRWVSCEAWSTPEQRKGVFVKNLRDRLRKQIEQRWPLEPLQAHTTERLVNQLLAQKSIQGMPHFKLHIAQAENTHLLQKDPH